MLLDIAQCPVVVTVGGGRVEGGGVRGLIMQ